jgi:hypothetical protein
MRILLIAGTAMVLVSVACGPAASTPSEPSAPPRAAVPPTAAQAQAADFKRPDVALLPAEGKFQVVSSGSWPGAKVRVFFLGAQF